MNPTLRRVTAALALLVAAGAACSVPARVETIGPGFDGTQVVRLRGNVLPRPRLGEGDLELNAERVDRPGRAPEYALLVEAHFEGLRIRPGESLHLLLAADTVRLSRDERSNGWPRPYTTILEQARFPCDSTVLRRVADAPQVDLVAVGAGWHARRTLSTANLATLRDFVARHVGGAQPRPAS